MATFEFVVPLLKPAEGGYVNDPDDRGGETNGGISKNAFPNLDVKNLTESERLKIYREKFWDYYRLGEIKSQLIANQIFILIINGNPLSIGKAIQKGVNRAGLRIPVDGVLGSQTIAAINTLPESNLSNCICLEAIRRYNTIADNDDSQKKFLVGWIRRALSCLAN